MDVKDHLPLAELQRLERVEKNADRAKRLRIIILGIEGWPAVAMAVGLTRRICQRWVRRYNEDGLAGLDDRRGREPRLPLTPVLSYVDTHLDSHRLTCLIPQAILTACEIALTSLLTMRVVPMLRVLFQLAALFALLSTESSLLADEFLLRDKDTVAFLGDSITAARGYTKTIEHYTLMRYPDRKITFYNAGKGGDTAQNSITRLQRDVFARGATVMLVALGVNDIGWGAKADAEHKQLYLDGIRALIVKCKAKQVRVVVCSPAITAEAPDTAEGGFLQKMVDEGLELAKSLGADTIDVQRGMRDIQRKIWQFNAGEPNRDKHVILHAADGIHLNGLGQLAMALVILKGLGAPDLVSAMAIDASDGNLIAFDGCSVTDIQVRKDGVTFARLDAGLPLNRGILSSLDHRWVPIPDRLNRYELRIFNLPAGDYTIHAEERSLGTVTAEQLSQGVNIASMTADAWEPGGPWDAQSDVVKELVDARDLLLYGRLLQKTYASNHPESAELQHDYAELDKRLIELQRKSARPRPFRFEVIRSK